MKAQGTRARNVSYSFRIDPYWTSPVEAVALWVNRKPNKEFDLQMTDSQEVLFWYERTIISCQFLKNLIRRKYFRIQVSMNTGTVSSRNCLSSYFLFFSVHTGVHLSIQFESGLDMLKANTETPPAACLLGSHLSIFVFISDSPRLILAKYSVTRAWMGTKKWCEIRNILSVISVVSYFTISDRQ